MLIVLRVVVPFPTTNLINNQTATVARKRERGVMLHNDQPNMGMTVRAKLHVMMAVVALAALMAATTCLTSDAPHITEDGIGGIVTGDRSIIHEGVKTKSSIASQRKQPPVEEEFLEIEAKADNENTLDRLGAALTATENKLNEQQHAAPAKAAAADAVVPQTAAATASSEQAEDPAVEKALKDAAEAKIQAMAAQQKALAAGATAKAAAAQAAQAPMTQAGQEVVRKAQQDVVTAKLDVDTARAAMTNLNHLKEKASKVIIDAAGGKDAATAGFAGQGGYFGAALQTAFKNGQLSEQLKTEQLKNQQAVKLQAETKKSYDEGETDGMKKGFIKGEKAGQREELPKAVVQAEKLLTKKKKKQESQADDKEKEAEDSALKEEAEKEASKVLKSVESKAKKTEAAPGPTAVDKTEATPGTTPVDETTGAESDTAASTTAAASKTETASITSPSKEDAVVAGEAVPEGSTNTKAA